MMTKFNTKGYSQKELDILNAEFEERFLAGNWPTEDKDEAEKWFDDEVARR